MKSNLSYWHLNNPNRGQKNFDVVIVGAGIVGLSTAYALKQKYPNISVAIVEARWIGAGASGRNAGFVLQGTVSDFATDANRYGLERTKRLWKFTTENRNLIAGLNPEKIGFRPLGSYSVAGYDAEAESLYKSVPLMQESGVEPVWLDKDDIRNQLGMPELPGGLFVPSNGVVNSGGLLRHLQELSDCALFENSPVSKIRKNRDGLIIETPSMSINTQKVLLATNAYLPQLSAKLRHIVEPVRAQMLLTSPAGPAKLDAPVYSHHGYFYVRQLADGRLLAGGGRHKHVEDEIGYDEITTPALQNDIEVYLRRYFPRLKFKSVEQRWSGVMGFSPDGIPVAGRLPEFNNVYYMTGFTGHGMGFGVRAGQMLADWMVGSKTPSTLDLFQVSRFNPEA